MCAAEKSHTRRGEKISRGGENRAFELSESRASRDDPASGNRIAWHDRVEIRSHHAAETCVDRSRGAHLKEKSRTSKAGLPLTRRILRPDLPRNFFSIAADPSFVHRTSSSLRPQAKQTPFSFSPRTREPDTRRD